MDIYIYFCATLLAFIFFFFLPILLIRPWKRKKVFHKLVAPQELKRLTLLMNHNHNVKQKISDLFDATAVDVLKTGKQDYFELKFRSFRESLNFKKAILTAGICMENHITIIRDQQEFQVIFMTSRKKVRL